MSDGERPGVTFPAGADGRRSTSALARAVVADALGRVDPPGALAATRESNWRSGYLTHFRRLVEAGLASRQAAVSVARDGLASLHQRMRVTSPDGTESGRASCREREENPEAAATSKKNRMTSTNTCGNHKSTHDSIQCDLDNAN